MRVRADYQVAATPALRQITEDFTLFEDPDDGYNLRWFEFDDGEDVAWYAHQSGLLGVPGGGFAEFQTALAAWNDDPGSIVDYTYAGTTTDTSGLVEYDDLNAILFDDPNGELPAFSCFGGGVLAYGGPWYETETTSYQGTLYHRIVNADIVVNNGLTCFFDDSPDASAAAEELFAHELGHTLGIGHSDFYQALMYPYIHDDGRGAALDADDRAAVAFLYGLPPAPTDFFTLAPCRLLDTRGPDGPYGGPIIHGYELRTVSAAGQCGIPATAAALSINVTVVAPSSGGYLALAPAGWLQPNTSVISFSAGQTRTNNALVLLSAVEPSFTIFPGIVYYGTIHVVVDVNGYFE